MKKEVSLISMHPFVRAFVLNIVRTIKEKKIEGERFVIDADLVPKVSGSVMMASMGRGVVRPDLRKEVRGKVIRRDMSELIASIERPMTRVVRALPLKQAVAPPVQPEPVAANLNVTPDMEDGYRKIFPLLTDPSVSTIECLGAGKELMIVRAGQRQRTRIVLGDKEIMGVLKKIAEDAHIPLLGGIFRASVPGFSISAVVSDMIGSRFVIKKATAYDLIE